MSLKTRAVMPTLVAVIDAARNTCATGPAPGAASRAKTNPMPIVATVPMTATRAAVAPTSSRSRTVDSRPTSNSSKSTPSCASMSSDGSEASPRVSAHGKLPSRMPATSSPRTGGCFAREAPSPESFATTSTMASTNARCAIDGPGALIRPWARPRRRSRSRARDCARRLLRAPRSPRRGTRARTAAAKREAPVPR